MQWANRLTGACVTENPSAHHYEPSDRWPCVEKPSGAHPYPGGTMRKIAAIYARKSTDQHVSDEAKSVTRQRTGAIDERKALAEIDAALAALQVLVEPNRPRPTVAG